MGAFRSNGLDLAASVDEEYLATFHPFHLDFLLGSR